MNLFNLIQGKYQASVVHQSEAAECGLACIAMVLAHHGHQIDLATLRSRFSVSLKGASLQSLMAVANQLELSPRPLRLDLEDLPELELPAILHWGLNHFVVLVKADKKRCVIHDPARGALTLDNKEVSQYFSGVALELRPTTQFVEKEEVKPVRITDFWSSIRGLAPSITQLFILSLLLQCVGLLMPLFQQMVVDDAITKQDLDFLTVLAMGFAMIGLINIALGWLRSYLMLYFSTALNFQMRLNLFRHLLKLPVDFFEKRHIGDITSRFGSLSPVANLFTSGFIAIVLDGIMAITTLVMAFFYSVKLTLIVIGFLIIGFIIELIIFPYEKRKNEEILHRSAKAQTNFLESIRGIRAIKLFGQESARESQWQNLNIDTLNSQITLDKFNINVGVGTGVIGVLQSVLTMYLSAQLVIEGNMTLGMLFAYQAYSGQFSSRLSALIGQFMEFRMLKLHLERLADIVHSKPEIEPSKQQQLNYDRKLAGQLSLKQIDFRYGEQDPWVFQNINLQVSPKEMIAITGPSGGGKSTLLKVMLGILKPQGGELAIDNTPLHSLGLEFYRQSIGVVMQNDQLLSGTLADNISFFDPELDMAFVERCAKAACIHDDIMKNPMGYDTLIGDMGTTLSGGQKQRVLLARALYRRPKILFLDEGTANLDMATEEKIAQLIKRLPITRIVIAHRPALIEAADRVLHMEDGVLSEIEYSAAKSPRNAQPTEEAKA
ncbi:peptidase domain-containing ABC transporter [uncultured Pseudoteredinibacter sp.]|uniref:peptidase domain-containing ABC transporter n=1 Tax=uncultured Pseudoteredinibacter sp. TaxID=1641701 RepID=UPI00262F348E|nr:peptidase domain-containing ABC transporter [uncultured Pseudoteredinibacter sp.]